MILELFGFLNLSFIDIIDILLMALIIFVVIRFLRDSSAMNIFLAILTLYVIRVVVAALGMRLMSFLMGTLLDVGVLALIVIFQPEIRRFLSRIGSRYRKAGSKGLVSRLLGHTRSDSVLDNAAITEIAEACRRMSEQRTGALLVFAHRDPLDDVIETGDRIDAHIQRRLIMNLFFKNSPLHDGALVVADGRLVAARCTLPITQSPLPARYGMRHKAAVGISEETDADVVVVSEETAEICFVRRGEITPVHNINELKLLLSSETEGEEGRDKE